MTSNVPHHERLFDEICNKLNELSRNRSEEDSVSHQEKMDRLQTQIRKFQTDLHDTQAEIRDKIKVLENVQIVQNSDMNQQLKQLTEQLNNERAMNTKLNADLAKSLELGLQLQLEIQNLRGRAQQIQMEERKYSQTLQEKIRQTTHDLELARALREEIDTELGKARSRLVAEQESSQKEKAELESQIRAHMAEKVDLLRANEELLAALNNKDQEISQLHAEMESMSSSFGELEGASQKQQEVLKNLTGVAENKIVELKIALDRKSAESRDYEGHLQQALTQNQLLRNENASLKDYIVKINAYLQSSSPAPDAPAPAAAPPPAP
ncbi:MAG: hypothetical protein KF802_06670 [Bdellovibrionaceae bacterium]|nr:hypothetical protein [Pseudobdellovibrionaceae bacterium]MBX3034410.1 hypothetical protein [Pseudobdellovibrionaceae bacterium]